MLTEGCKWKKTNVVTIHKKGDKQTIKSDRPVSLLPICEKIFERLLYDTMFDFLYHEILSAFDMWLEVRGIFLDIFKAFDKV